MYKALGRANTTQLNAVYMYMYMYMHTGLHTEIPVYESFEEFDQQWKPALYRFGGA